METKMYLKLLKAKITTMYLGVYNECRYKMSYNNKNQMQ